MFASTRARQRPSGVRIAQALAAAVHDICEMAKLRALLADWMRVAMMSDHEIVHTLSRYISAGIFDLFEPNRNIAWGRAVSAEFKDKVIAICDELDIETDFLMAAMAFESAGTFRSDVKNSAGSGAVGLIQFMPETAKALQTSTDQLAQMSPVAQLDFVREYFKPYRGRLSTIEDVYMVILYPAAVGRENTFVLFDKTDPKHPKRYIQNQGLDIDRDGKITKSEAAAGVKKMLERGRSEKFLG